MIRQSSSPEHSRENLYCCLEGGREPRCSKQRGSGSATFMRRSPSKLVLPWHEPLPLSKSACVRIPMMSISHSDLMPIRAERSDAGLSQCETVIDIRQEFC